MIWATPPIALGKENADQRGAREQGDDHREREQSPEANEQDSCGNEHDG